MSKLRPQMYFIYNIYNFYMGIRIRQVDFKKVIL